jgi:NADPH-dependent glutamate synthase beta subunit-like oxidoreductase
MKLWQVLGRGEGFIRDGRIQGFELSGVVAAVDPNEAFEKAILLAKSEWPEISQSERKGSPRAVINASEVEDVTARLTVDVDRIELRWD